MKLHRFLRRSQIVLFSCLILFSIVNCKSGSNPLSKIPKDAIALSLDIPKSAECCVLDSIFTGSIFIVPLELDSNNPIGRILKGIHFDSRNYILDDKNELFIYGEKGNCIRMISHHSKTTKALIEEIRDFIVMDSVLVVLDYKRLHFFTHDGQYKYSRLFSSDELINPIAFCFVGNSLVLFDPQYVKGGSRIYQLFDNGATNNIYTYSNNGIVMGSVFYPDIVGEGLYTVSPKSDSILYIRKDGFFVKYVIDSKNLVVSDVSNTLERNNGSVTSPKPTLWISGFFEIPNKWIVFNFAYNNQLCFGSFNLRDGRSYCLTGLYSKFIFPKSILSVRDDELLSFCYALDFINPNKWPSQGIVKQWLDSMSYSSLGKIKEFDNPVLVLYKMK